MPLLKVEGGSGIIRSSRRWKCGIEVLACFVWLDHHEDGLKYSQHTEEEVAMKRAFDKSKWDRVARSAMLCLVGALAASGAAAQTYPSKPITILVTSAIGGSPDVALRLITNDITARTGKNFLIEARPGAGGAVGLSAVHRAEPDGHTIAYTFTGALLVNPYTTKELGWFPTSFAPIGRIFNSPTILVGDPKFPARNMNDVIRIAKEKPNTVSIAIGGSGNKIGLAQIESATGAKFIWVPVAGTPRTHALGGHVNLAVETPSSVKSLVDEGKLTSVAIGSEVRFPYMPNVQPIAEVIPGFQNGFWFALLAPPATPADRVTWLSRELLSSATKPSTIAKLKELALEPIAETPQQFDAYLRKTGPEFEKIIKEFNIQ